jgi:rSAM/selenodomain-associated transferase 1
MMPTLTGAQACELHCELLRWTSRRLVGSGLGPVQLSVAGSLNHPVLSECLVLGVDRLAAQHGADLGERMHGALVNALQQYTGAVLVGSDCPAIDSDYLEAAINGLARAPVVLGPAQDGGYVLIAVRQVDARLFEGIHWGTDTVYQETVARLRELGLDWVALPTLQDIDRPEDLPAWHQLRMSTPNT